MSRSHIYHSALPLSPETSMVQMLYGSLASHFVRVVQDESDVGTYTLGNDGKRVHQSGELLVADSCESLAMSSFCHC